MSRYWEIFSRLEKLTLVNYSKMSVIRTPREKRCSPTTLKLTCSKHGCELKVNDNFIFYLYRAHWTQEQDENQPINKSAPWRDWNRATILLVITPRFEARSTGAQSTRWLSSWPTGKRRRTHLWLEVQATQLKFLKTCIHDQCSDSRLNSTEN